MRASRLRACASFAALAAMFGGALAGGCSDPDRPPYLQGSQLSTGVGTGPDLDSGTGGPPSPDASGLCGNQIHSLIVDAPNLYFVLDASGSMAAKTTKGTSYDQVRVAVVDLVRTLGPLINVGAAVFPRHASEADTCHVGEQVFPVTPGDPVTGTGEDGPTTDALRQSTLATPFGGTPTSATLEAITPTLKALPGKTFVVLATDGGPNCNDDATCTAAECEGGCEPNINCCAPGGSAGPAYCVDRLATVAAIETIAGAGIPVYVVGIPGSELYAQVLGDMAKAGGVPQPNAPYYLQVQELGALAGALSSIADVVVTCTFDLVDPPAEAGYTNVYFDQTLVPNDAQDGWVWKTPTTIEIVGASCSKLKKGEVKQVQIVLGCPTEVK